jgi:hypothetical protein
MIMPKPCCADFWNPTGAVTVERVRDVCDELAEEGLVVGGHAFARLPTFRLGADGGRRYARRAPAADHPRGVEMSV